MKLLIRLFIITLLVASCKSSSPIVTTKSDSDKDNSVSKKEKSSKTIKKILKTANSRLGVKYKTGGTTKSGYDCSGFVYTTFKEHDIELPRSSTDMAKVGKKISTKRAQKGDLIFFKTNGKSIINHVGIIVEVAKDEIKFIHSATQSGVILSSTKETYYKRTFAQINRMI